MLSVSYLLLTPHHLWLLISSGPSSSVVIALFEISQRKLVRGGTRLLDKVREVGCKDAHSIRDFPRRHRLG
jgi:hypothetical protein